MFNRTPQVDAVQARRLVDGGAMLIDVRGPDEWDAGHAPGALHIPLDQLPSRVGDVAGAEQVVMVCRSGSRSARATQWLLGHGVDAVNLGGGMQAWACAGGSVVRDDGSVGRVA